MKYFLHDSNAFQDEKISELYMKFGFEGLGLFYTILEKLAMQEKPIKTDVLKMQLFVGRKLERCWKFLESSGLISSNNGETFNENLLKFSEKYLLKKDKNRERITEWRKNQVLSDDVTRYNAVTERVRNSPKDNISKDNIIKDTIPSNEGIPRENQTIEFLEKSEHSADNIGVTAKEKKATQTGGAKSKTTAHLFQDSEYSDLETFKAKFTGSEYETADLAYYFRSVSDWSAAGGNKKVDWIATARGFMNRDSKEGKLATNRSKVIPINQQSQLSSRLELANRVSNMFQYDEQGKMI
jgi:hypothetical protein